MDWIFHIVALVWMAFIAAIWTSAGFANIMIKLAAVLSAAFAAVMVAKDWA